YTTLFRSGAEPSGRSNRMRHQIEPGDGVRRQRGSCRQPGQKFGLVNGPDRIEMVLAVWFAVVPVEVNGQMRDPCDRLVDRHEVFGAVVRDEAPADTQVA